METPQWDGGGQFSLMTSGGPTEAGAPAFPMGLSSRGGMNPGFAAHALTPSVGYMATTSLESSSWNLLMFEHSSKCLFDINKSPIACEPPCFLRGPPE